MKTSGIKAMGFATLLSAGAALTGCAKKERVLYEATNVPVITEFANSLSNKTSQVLQDTSLKCFYQDTLEISKNCLKHTKKFLTAIKDLANSNNPVIHIGKKSDDCIDYYKFINITPVIEEGLFTDEKGKKFYIPVAGYGSINPFLTKK